MAHVVKAESVRMAINGVEIPCVDRAFGPRSVRHSHDGQEHTHEVHGNGVLGPAKRGGDELPRSFSMTIEVTHGS